MLANLTQLIGAAVVVYGLFLVWVPLAFIAAGAALFTAGVVLEKPTEPKSKGAE